MVAPNRVPLLHLYIFLQRPKHAICPNLVEHVYTLSFFAHTCRIKIIAQKYAELEVPSQPGFCLNRQVWWEKSRPLAVPSLDKFPENEIGRSGNFAHKVGNLPEMK